MAYTRLIALASALLVLTAAPALAARCGNTAAGFEKWKRSFAKEAKANGIGKRGISALMGTRYSYGTVKADRGQHSFKLSLNQFMKKRGAAAIASQGKRYKRSNATLLKAIERKYGVPPGPLLAIWGMETGFGRYMGKQNTLSAVATLAYDCRRPQFFTPHLYAALQLIDRGRLSAAQRGAMHGEVGHTQFLPPTANFLRGHGWQPGAGYQPGQPNYRAIQGWNAAGVYQQTIAIVGLQIDNG